MVPTISNNSSVSCCSCGAAAGNLAQPLPAKCEVSAGEPRCSLQHDKDVYAALLQQVWAWSSMQQLV